jgi:hypothetical protein
MGRLNSMSRFERFAAYLITSGQTGAAAPTDWKELDRFFLSSTGDDEGCRFQMVLDRIANGEAAPDRKALVGTATAANPVAKAAKSATTGATRPGKREAKLAERIAKAAKAPDGQTAPTPAPAPEPPATEPAATAPAPAPAAIQAPGYQAPATDARRRPEA